MNYIKKCLAKQRQHYFSNLLQGACLTGIGVAGSIMIPKNGIGENTGSEYSAGNILNKFLNKIMAQSESAEQIVPLCFAGFFLVLAIIGLGISLKAVWNMFPKHTMLGKSVVAQVKSSETLPMVFGAINEDLERGCKIFGPVLIGREWILEAEAMRLSQVKGIFTIDAGKKAYVLCLVDEQINIWGCGLTKKEERDDAKDYLEKMLPHVATGGKEDYMAFLKTLSASAESEENSKGTSKKSQAEVHGIELSEKTVFSLAKTDGIPTSNFTYEDVLYVIESLEVKETMAIALLNGESKTEKLRITRISIERISVDRYEVCIDYREEEKKYSKTKDMHLKEAEDILNTLLSEYVLPDFSICW